MDNNNETNPLNFKETENYSTSTFPTNSINIESTKIEVNRLEDKALDIMVKVFCVN